MAQSGPSLSTGVGQEVKEEMAAHVLRISS